MRTITKAGDRLLSLFVPKAEAEAIYIWVYRCVSYPECSRDRINWFPTYVKMYCHDSTGHCPEVIAVGCCD